MDGNVNRDATQNSDQRINLTDTRSTDRNWQLKAVMTDFENGNDTITVGLGSGIGLDIENGGAVVVNPIDSSGARVVISSENAIHHRDTNQQYSLTTNTDLTLDRNELLPTTAAGTTFQSDITWTLEDGLTF